ncbi:translation initiation factor IF-2-like [Coturnix japonica]|uniref:translation initiation factor IF-2-like n=1 Tax=Coturnix japonica TaxID=93934 RepID=UPI0013A5D841|nr:translation initiation factor IF-2-like [Coturnix japonica]
MQIPGSSSLQTLRTEGKLQSLLRSPDSPVVSCCLCVPEVRCWRKAGKRPKRSRSLCCVRNSPTARSGGSSRWNPSVLRPRSPLGLIPRSSRPRTAASLAGVGAECCPARPLPTGTAHRTASHPPYLSTAPGRAALSPVRPAAAPRSPQPGSEAAGIGEGAARPRPPVETNHAPHHASERFVKTFI